MFTLTVRAAAFLLVLIVPLSAQDPTATLSGTVTDVTGAALTGASAAEFSKLTVHACFKSR